MKIMVDGLAWLPVSEMTATQTKWLKRRLTVADVDVSGGHRDASLAYAFVEREGMLGIPRGFLYSSITNDHDIVEKVSSGDDWPAHRIPRDGETWARCQDDDPSELTLVDAMSGDLSEVFSVADQRHGFGAAMSHLGSRECADGIVSFESNWDSVKLCLALVRSLRVKTLILCPKGMSFTRWETLSKRYLPDAVLGFIDQDRFEQENCHITLSTPFYVRESLDRGDLDGNEFGFVVSDQIERMKPVLWSSVVSRLSAGKRLGLSSGPFDGTGKRRIFSYHLGKPLFIGEGTQLKPKIRRVWSKWRASGSSWANPQFMSRAVSVEMMIASAIYNRHIVEQVLLALRSDRKIAVFSESLKHLKALKVDIDARWSGRALYTDYLIHGMADDEMVCAANADVVFVRYDFAESMPDTPGIDTVILSTPTRLPHSAIACALDPLPEKKHPVVVDMRCDAIPVCKRDGGVRDGVYRRLYGDRAVAR